MTPRHSWSATVTACAFRADGKIGLAGVGDEPSGLCDSTDLLPSLSGAVLRPSAPRERVPSSRARHRSDAELRAGHRRKTPADRLHLGRIFNSRGGRRREARCLAASDVRLHPPLAGGSARLNAPRLRIRPTRRCGRSRDRPDPNRGSGIRGLVRFLVSLWTQARPGRPCGQRCGSV